MKTFTWLSTVLVCTAASCLARDAAPQVKPLGGAKIATTLPGQPPPAQLRTHLVGVHIVKTHPSMQMETHHFCRQVNADLAQCVLFDGNTPDANLSGIEYVISNKLFQQLPAKERKYWHPHNYEILSGQLIAPGLSGSVEKEILQTRMNTYGKAWQVWNTGHFGLNDADKLPLGEPQLAWSLNQDGEILPDLTELLEERVGVNVAQTRIARQELMPLAKPQVGAERRPMPPGNVSVE